jgi:Domain of unknown function (DUF4418)
MKVLAIAIMAMALVIAIAPQYTNCEATGDMGTGASATMPKMKCLWSARAEIPIGVGLFASGGLLLFSRRRETRMALGGLTAVLGLMAILVPVSLIGTCMSGAAVCNTTMAPIIYVSGGISIALGLAALTVAGVGRGRRADAVAAA